MSVDAFYDAVLATLAVHGFIAVEADNLVRIVPDATARAHPGAAGGAADDPAPAPGAVARSVGSRMRIGP